VETRIFAPEEPLEFHGDYPRRAASRRGQEQQGCRRRARHQHHNCGNARAAVMRKLGFGALSELLRYAVRNPIVQT
jgi:hypothetical protein